MPNLNTSQIIGIGNEILGRSISDSEAQSVMNATGGGQEGQVRAYFQSDPQLAEKKAREQAEALSARSKTEREAAISDLVARNQQAVQPAVSSLEASIPEISAQFNTRKEQLGAERAPLEERYDNLLNQIKGNQTTAENRQTVATKQELARRGIQGGLMYDQELVNALNPITQQYTTLYRDTGLQKEAGVRDLINQITNLDLESVSQTRDVRNAIAQILASAGQTGVSQGIGAGQFDTQLYAGSIADALTRAMQQRQFDLNYQLQKEAQAEAASQARRQQDLQDLIYRTIQLPTFQQVTLPSAQYDLNKPYYKPTAALSSQLGGGSDLGSLFSEVFGGQ